MFLTPFFKGLPCYIQIILCILSFQKRTFLTWKGIHCDGNRHANVIFGTIYSRVDQVKSLEDRLYKICLSRLYPFKFLKRLSFTNFTCSIFWVLCPICYTTPCRLYRYKNCLFLRWCFTIFFTSVSYRCFKRIKTSWFCFLRVYKCFIKSIKAVLAQRLLFSWEGILNLFFFFLV